MFSSFPSRTRADTPSPPILPAFRSHRASRGWEPPGVSLRARGAGSGLRRRAANALTPHTPPPPPRRPRCLPGAPAPPSRHPRATLPTLSRPLPRPLPRRVGGKGYGGARRNEDGAQGGNHGDRPRRRRNGGRPRTPGERHPGQGPAPCGGWAKSGPAVQERRQTRRVGETRPRRTGKKTNAAGGRNPAPPYRKEDKRGGWAKSGFAVQERRQTRQVGETRLRRTGGKKREAPCGRDLSRRVGVSGTA